MNKTTTYDCKSMLLNSTNNTLKFIKELMHKGEYEAAKKGIDELFDFETKTEKTEMQKALVRLMEAIIVWNESPEHKTGEQIHEIFEATQNLEFFIEEETELNYDYLKSVWDKANKRAKKYTEIKLQTELNIQSLTWAQVFETEYTMFDAKTER